MALGPTHGWAQAVTSPSPEAGGPGSRVTASLDGSLSLRELRSSLSGNGLETVAELRPGLRLSSRQGRLVGSLAYSAGLQARDGETGGQGDVVHQLNSAFSLEAVERWLYLDGSASYGRQTADPFGRRGAPGSASIREENQLEVAQLSLSPSVRGRLLGAATYDLRLTASAVNARRSIATDSTSTTASLTVASPVAGAMVGWALQASAAESDFKAGRQTRNDRVIGTLTWLPDVDWTVATRAGQESTDAQGGTRQRYDNWGAGVTWRPSPRTRAQVDVDERYFGRAHKGLVEHRTAQTAVLLSSTRSVSSGGVLVQVPVSLFDLLMAASPEPDRALREQQVLALLAADGRDPNALVNVGVLASSEQVTETHSLTASYTRRRLSLTAQGFRSQRRSLQTLPSASALDAAVRQSGYVGTASYRLSPESSVSLNGSRTMVQPSLTRPGTDLKSLSLNWGTRLGRQTVFSLDARYSVFNSQTAPYRETALSARLGHRF